MIHPQGKKKMMATTSRQGPSTQQLQMDKVMEEYEYIFTSPAGVPLHCQVKHSIDLTPVFVQKNDWTWRLCIDYQALNKIIIRNTNPMPWINDLLDQLTGEKYFKKINLKSRYHQVPIEPSDVWKTAFKAKQGLFEWLVMPFRLMNTLATFMMLVDDILWTFTNSFVVVYLDDILIFSQSWEDHLHHIRQVLQTLRKHKLCSNLEKCTFGMTQV
eukprot:PITA_13070